MTIVCNSSYRLVIFFWHTIIASKRDGRKEEEGKAERTFNLEQVKTDDELSQSFEHEHAIMMFSDDSVLVLVTMTDMEW